MTTFAFSPRWTDIASSWDEEGATVRDVWRYAVEVLEARDRDLEDYLRRMLSSIDAWVAFTPTLYFGATVLGHQSDTGRLLTLGRLRVVTVHTRITNIGGATGTMAMDLPVNQRVFTDPVNANINAGGVARCVDISAGQGYSAIISPSAAGTQINFLASNSSPNTPWTHLAPMTWAAGANGVGDEIGLTYIYESAS